MQMQGMKEMEQRKQYRWDPQAQCHSAWMQLRRLVSENAAVKCKGTALTGSCTPLDQISLHVRLSGVRNMYNQLAAKVDRMTTQGVARTQQFKPSYNGGQCQQYRGGGGRGGTARGGYSKDTLKSNFQRDREEDQELPGNATGYFIRVGLDEKIAFAGCARVKVQAEERGDLMVAIMMEKETVVEKPQVCGGNGQDQERVKTRIMKIAVDIVKEGMVEEAPMPGLVPEKKEDEAGESEVVCMEMEGWAWGSRG